MKPVDQNLLGFNGNCVAACVATLLELPLSEVPHFCDGMTNAWTSDIARWLKPRGFGIISVGILNQAEHLDNMRTLSPGVAWVALGKSPGGLGHAVVFIGDKMAHDPHPKREGLVPGSIDGGVFIVPNAVRSP